MDQDDTWYGGRWQSHIWFKVKTEGGTEYENSPRVVSIYIMEITK